MEQLDVRTKTEYGASELRKYSKKYSTIALIIALAFHFLGVGVYWGTVYLTKTDASDFSDGFGLSYPGIVLPPTWTPPVVGSVPGGLKPRVGTPVPVHITEVDTNATIPTQIDLGQEPGDVNVGPISGGGKDLAIDENQPPKEYVPYESPPAIVKQVPPKYPDLASRAGLEGTVWVKIWVDKEGRPRKAVVQKTDAEIFNQPATDAALQWVFIPAMMKNGPVSVWVSIPFRFKLQGK